MNNNQTFSKPYSEETAKLIDDEARSMIDVQYKRAQKLLTDKQQLLDDLANELLKKEVLFKDDLERVLGKRPYEKAPLLEDEVSTNVNNESSQVEKEGDIT
jgi:cell division protease FtsH